MSPIIDTATGYHVRAASDLVLDDSANCIISHEIWGTGIHGMALYVYVPASTQGCNPVLTVAIHASTTSAAATTDPLIATRTITESMAAEARTWVVPFFTEKRSVAFAFEVSGGSTPAFSSVDAYLVQNVGLEWDRRTQWA